MPPVVLAIRVATAYHGQKAGSGVVPSGAKAGCTSLLQGFHKSHMASGGKSVRCKLYACRGELQVTRVRCMLAVESGNALVLGREEAGAAKNAIDGFSQHCIRSAFGVLLPN